MNDSHGFPWYTIPMVTITVGRWFTSLVVAMPKGPWISRRKRTKGRKWRREVTRSFGTENNQEINMQGGPFQRSLNGVTGGALLNFLAENKWPNWSFSLAFLGNWWPFWDGELRSRDPFRSKVGMVTETKKSGMKFGHDLNHLVFASGLGFAKFETRPSLPPLREVRATERRRGSGRHGLWCGGRPNVVPDRKIGSEV